MAMRVRVADSGDVPVGKAVVVHAGGRRLALCRPIEDEWYAIDDMCTHDGGPLGEGELSGYEIECPRHGALFDVRTGEALTLPATRPVNAYKVYVEGNEVFVELPE
ncbi:MAG: non-heme iron oxygenase ferredoxin subunit [Chthonomonadetes bacterium]|nr:non-heme iron oxygenase ferredoxin subunit [Chthonomonadetes bacterium]